MADFNDRATTSGDSSSTRGADWSTERQYWQENYRNRPYATADRGFEHYEPGYRYGSESAQRLRGRDWNDAENDLRSGWDRYEHRGSNKSTWEEVKDSVKDAWDRVTGKDRDTRHADESKRRTF